MALNTFPKILRLMLLLLLWGMSSISNAVDEKAELSIDSIDSEMKIIETAIDDKTFLLENIDAYLKQLPLYSIWVKTCVEKARTDVLAYQAQPEKLGGSVLDEPADSKSIRTSILDKKSVADKTLSSCKALLVRSESATREISEFRQKNLQEQSFTRGIDLLTAASKSITESHQWVYKLAKITVSTQGIQTLPGSEKLMLMSIIVLAIVSGLILLFERPIKQVTGSLPVRWKVL